jgi:hypothetical protein
MTTTLIGNIYVDAVAAATPSAPLKVSSHPIEDGSLVSDYVSEEGETLTLECAFADDVLVSRGAESRVNREATRLTTAADKEQAIYDLKKNRTLVDITLPRKFFSNMLLIDIQESITAKNSKGFKPTLIFQKIKTVKTGTTAIPLDRIKKKPVAKQEAADKQKTEDDRGQQSTKELKEAELKEVAKSLIYDYLGGA